MDGAVIAQWVATGIIGLGLIGTWLRNGRSQSEKFGKVEGKIEGLSKRMDSFDSRVLELSKRIDKLLDSRGR
jgi:hypothetical protein